MANTEKSPEEQRAEEKKAALEVGVHKIEQENIERQNKAIDEARDYANSFTTRNNVEEQQKPIRKDKLASAQDVDVHEMEKANIAHWGDAADAEKEFAAKVQKSGRKADTSVEAQAEAASEADASVEAAEAAEAVEEAKAAPKKSAKK